MSTADRSCILYSRRIDQVDSRTDGSKCQKQSISLEIHDHHSRKVKSSSDPHQIMIEKLIHIANFREPISASQPNYLYTPAKERRSFTPNPSFRSRAVGTHWQGRYPGANLDRVCHEGKIPDGMYEHLSKMSKSRTQDPYLAYLVMIGTIEYPFRGRSDAWACRALPAARWNAGPATLDFAG